MNWEEIWKEFDERYEKEVDEAFQEDIQAAYGKYYADAFCMSPEEGWKYQKKLIQKIVEEKLNES